MKMNDQTSNAITQLSLGRGTSLYHSVAAHAPRDVRTIRAER